MSYRYFLEQADEAKDPAGLAKFDLAVYKFPDRLNQDEMHGAVPEARVGRGIFTSHPAPEGIEYFSNFNGTDPGELNRRFRPVYTEANEWVVLPNVLSRQLFILKFCG